MRASVATGGGQSEGGNDFAAISGNGRYVAFASGARNLVAGDTNDTQDVFVRDLQSGRTERVSLGSGGAQANGYSGFNSLSISADGRYVAFQSFVSNLVRDDTNGTGDIFVRDRWRGTTIRGSLGASGQQLASGSSDAALSPDGRFLAFGSSMADVVPGDTRGTGDIFLRDLARGTVRRVSVRTGGAESDGPSYSPSVSRNGSSVAFASAATNLVPIDTNGVGDVFVHNVATGQTRRRSVGSDGSQGNGASYGTSISDDGKRVAFESFASTLVAGDSNNAPDAFVADRSTGRTILVSVSISPDGSVNRPTSFPRISGDGRYVAFDSFASNFVPGDTNDGPDVFVRDLCRQVTRLASIGLNGTIGNGYSFQPSISSDGRKVAFASAATSLVSGETNNKTNNGFDIFVSSSDYGHHR